MKKIYTIILLLAFCISGFSQSLTFVDSYGNNISNTEITVTGHPDSLIVAYHVHVKNNAANSISVKVKKTEISTIPNTANYFCWVNCYQPTTFVSTSSLNMAAGYTTSGAEDLQCDYMPSGQVGVTKIAYTAFDKNETNDSVRLIINFDISTSIDLLSKNEFGFSQPYPNPVKDIVSFSYNIENYSNLYVELYDMLGKTLQKQYIRNPNGKISFNTSGYKSGIYYYSIISHEKVVKTNRFIIAK